MQAQSGKDRRRGLMLVISSPSGAGKSTIARALLAHESHLTPSISMTTRPMRPGEVEGREYYFRSIPAFQAMVEADAFYEHAQVFDHFYGTPKQAVCDLLAEGRDVLFDIDWQGARLLTGLVPTELVKLFILPPSLQELEHRLRLRCTDSDAVIARRMAQASDEISHYRDYEYVLVNHNVKTCVAQIRSILQAERLKRIRNPEIDALAAQMRA